jgi:hypothetical protein
VGETSVNLTKAFLPANLITCMQLLIVSVLKLPCSVSRTTPSKPLHIISETVTEGICCQDNIILKSSFSGLDI